LFIKKERYNNGERISDDLLFNGRKELYYTDFINRKMQLLMEQRHNVKKEKIDKYKENWKALAKK